MNTTLPIAVNDQSPAALLGEPGFDLFAEWRSTQPDNAELDQLTAAVQEAETNLADLRARLPVVLAARTKAEDAGDGAAYADACAELGGLPRRISAAAGQRVRANVGFLARLAVVAQRACAAAQSAQAPMQAEMAAARRDLFGQESGSPLDAPMSHGDRAIVESVHASLRGEALPLQVAERKAREVADSARIRAEFFGPGIDLQVPSSWTAAVTMAETNARKLADREAATYGK